VHLVDRHGVVGRAQVDGELTLLIEHLGRRQGGIPKARCNGGRHCPADE